MNWATIAPETRLFKGNSLYRWEVSPGLDHHCGVCATPLHNARAKTSCIGKHVEPCYRFHQQLHFVNKSHECFGCNKSDQMHHGRHKEILKIMRNIEALDELTTPSHRAVSIPSQARRGSSITTSADFFTNLTDANSDSPGDNCIKLKRSERKKLKKCGLGRKRDVEVFSHEDMNFVSEAIHLCIHESKGASEGTYIYNTIQKADQMEPENTITAADRTVSSNASPLTDLTPRQRKVVKKFSTPIKHSSFQGGSRKASLNSSTDILNGIDPSIFSRLGVDTNRPSSAARKELVVKLVAAIKLDLDVISQEEQEAEIREEGFWRFAGKPAYSKIANRRKDYDWATGQKKTIIDDTPTCFDDGSDDVLLEEAAIPPQKAKTPLSEVADNRGRFAPSRIVNPGPKVFTFDAKDDQENQFKQLDGQAEATSSYMATNSVL